MDLGRKSIDWETQSFDLERKSFDLERKSIHLERKSIDLETKSIGSERNQGQPEPASQNFAVSLAWLRRRRRQKQTERAEITRRTPRAPLPAGKKMMAQRQL